MPELTITGQSGDKKTVEVESGLTLMEVIRDAGFDEMMAMCGGCCSCATCHVFVDEQYADKIPVMDEIEDDLLGMSDHRSDNSRLSCQVTVNDELDGLKVVIAPED